MQRMALIFGACTMALAPILTKATVLAPSLNHYSDYGVVEQNQSVTSGGVSINNDPFGYSDEYADPESGLQYLQVRYYNPILMRFTQMDTYPLLNRYAYGNENPIMNDDPSGHIATGEESANSNKVEGFNIGNVIIGFAQGFQGLLVGLSSFNPILVAGAITSLTSDVSQMVVDTTKNSKVQNDFTEAASVFSDISMVFTAWDVYNTKEEYIDMAKEKNQAFKKFLNLSQDAEANGQVADGASPNQESVKNLEEIANNSKNSGSAPEVRNIHEGELDKIEILDSSDKDEENEIVQSASDNKSFTDSLKEHYDNQLNNLKARFGDQATALGKIANHQAVKGVSYLSYGIQFGLQGGADYLQNENKN